MTPLRRSLPFVGLAALALGVLTHCKTRQPDAARVLADETAADPPIVAYAKQCMTELGIASLPPMSCTLGELKLEGGRYVPVDPANGAKEVPINFSALPTTEGGEPNRRTIDKDTWDTFVAGGKKCDNPQWLESNCYPYDITSVIHVSDDVDAILNCRQKFYTEGANNGLSRAERLAAFTAETGDNAAKKAKYDHYGTFDDLGFILRNKNTGKTCWFTIFSTTYYGAFLPPPDMKTLPDKAAFYDMLPDPKPPREAYDDEYWYKASQDTYMSVGNMTSCVTCHSTGGGFKYSPFFAGADVLPEIGVTVDKFNNSTGALRTRRLPYLPVGTELQRAFSSARLKEVTTVDIKNGGDFESQVCTRCHRIASNQKCFVEWTVGRFGSPDCSEVQNVMTEHSLAWGQRAWMPQGHTKRTQAEYDTAYKKHIDTLLCCMADPTKRGCKSRSYGPTEADVVVATNKTNAGWTLGNGAGSCVAAADMPPSP